MGEGGKSLLFYGIIPRLSPVDVSRRENARARARAHAIAPLVETRRSVKSNPARQLAAGQRFRGWPVHRMAVGGARQGRRRRGARARGVRKVPGN